MTLCPRWVHRGRRVVVLVVGRLQASRTPPEETTSVSSTVSDPPQSATPVIEMSNIPAFCGRACHPSRLGLQSQPMADSHGQNYYELLNVPRTASPAEIKASYHRLLLSLHPDKSDASKDRPAQMDVDIGRLKEAFVTLTSPESRIKYDSELSSRPDSSSSRSRPAHIISLEDFEDLGQIWAYDCRCGGRYTIEEEDMEKDIHLMACSSCSEVIWVGYEAYPSDDGDINPGGP